MRKRRLAAVFLLVNATLLPNSLVFADTVLSMFKQQKHLPYQKMKAHHPNQAYLERIPIKI